MEPLMTGGVVDVSLASSSSTRLRSTLSCSPVVAASITFVSGALGDRPNAYGTAILAAASAAMEALARGLALELAPRRVNTLSPGPIDTPLLGKALGSGRDAYVASLKALASPPARHRGRGRRCCGVSHDQRVDERRDVERRRRLPSRVTKRRQ